MWPKALLKIPVFVVCFLTAKVYATINFDSNDPYLSRVSTSIQPQLDLFLNATLASIPTSLRTRLSSNVLIRFKSLGLRALPTPQCAPLQRHPAEPNEFSSSLQIMTPSNAIIYLHMDFLKELLLGEEKAPAVECGYGNFYRWAQTELLLQILRLYERENPLSPGQWKDWKALLSRLQPETGLNDSESLKLRWAQFASHYFLDPEFPCRWPSIAQKMQAYFGSRPSGESSSCTLNSTLWITSSGQRREIRLERLYEIHFLMADPGPQLESKWGHVMFRLVLCAPHRASVSAECLNDLNDHLMVGFLGHPTGLTISTWGGLTGKYPSRLVVEEFAHILREYTIKESRSLTSYPLRMNVRERELFFHRFLEEYWTYQGRYFFLTNNCATETLHFLQSLSPIRPHLVKIDPVIDTPEKLKNALMKAHLLEVPPAGKPNKESPYIFLSPKQQWNSQIATTTDNPQIAPVVELDSNVHPRERRDLFDHLRQQNPDRTKSLAEQFYRFELSVYNLGERKIDFALQKIIQGDPQHLNGEYRRLAYRIQTTKTFMLPPFRVIPGHGIPLLNELKSDSLGENIQSHIQRDQLQIRELLKKDKPGLFLFMHEANQNMIYFYQFIKPAVKAKPNKEVL